MSDIYRHILVQKALDTIRRGNMTCSRVLVALSGGADSMALLHFFNSYRNELDIMDLHAAHINHGLRGEQSQADEQFVRQQCQMLKIPLTVHSTDVTKEAAKHSEGLEQAGRRVRYEFLTEQAKMLDASIATAHTQSDNAETLLLHITRGSGLNGLTGIAPVREIANDVSLIRPLLDCSRKEVESYCELYAIKFVTDLTNYDATFSRNRIRLNVMPELIKINPKAEQAFARLIKHVREDAILLDKLAHEQLRKSEINDSYGGYDAAMLRNLPTALRVRTLLAAVKNTDEKAARALTHDQLEIINKMLVSRGALTLINGYEARVSQGRLLISKCYSNNIKQNCEEISLEIGISCSFYGRIYRLELLSLDDFEKWNKIHKNLLKRAFNYDKIKGNIFLRSRKSGDAFQPSGRNITKTLKKLFNEQGVPVNQRNEIAVLCDQQGIVLVDGFGCDQRVFIDDECSRVAVLYIVQ